MKVGIIGAGGVGAACIFALIMRNCVQKIIVIDKNQPRAQAIATDFQYGESLSSPVMIQAGNYSDLVGSEVIIITAGINEKAGGATDRNDPKGRLKLLNTNKQIFNDIVPQIAANAPDAIILVATDPPDPLAEYARTLTKSNTILSTGTFLDSMRFRFHLARYFNVSPLAVDALVVGEHGTSEVFLWSTVRIGGEPLATLLAKTKQTVAALQQQIEQEVRFANITIIEGNNASQYGIGMICARIAEIILQDEKAVIPIGSYNLQYGVTLSLPSILSAKGIERILHPEMNAEEKQALQRSADIIKQSLAN